MKLKITSCADENIFRMDIGSKIITDGEMEFGKAALFLLQNDIIAKKSFVAQDIEDVTEKIIGVIIVDEGETYVEIVLAYVIKNYRKKGVCKAMIQQVQNIAKEKQKTIRLYCNKEYCKIYESCGFKTDDKLSVMIFDEKMEENNG